MLGKSRKKVILNSEGEQKALPSFNVDKFNNDELVIKDLGLNNKDKTVKSKYQVR